MARYDKMQVMNKMASTGMVPVFYHPTPEVACQVMQATTEVYVCLSSPTVATLHTRCLPDA